MSETKPQFHCNTCNLDFKNNAYYKKHLSTRRHGERSNSTSANIITIGCICGRSYSYHQSLYVHRKKCEKYQNLNNNHSIEPEAVPSPCDSNLREKMKSYEKELSDLKSQVAILLDKQATSVQTTNNISQTNNNITININAFGNENTDYIDSKSIIACIGRVYKSIPSLLEKIHFDPKHPENHNIKITNKKLAYASVMGNNQKWKTVDRKDAIETMVLNGYNMLDEKYTENKEKIPVSKQQNFEGFQTKFESEDKELIKQIKTDVDVIVLNGCK